MRRFVTAGFLALTVALFAGCSDQDKESPTEPSFTKDTSTECLDTEQQDLKSDIDAEIERLFDDRKSKRGAYEIVNNQVRKLCKEPIPQYHDALSMAWDFTYLVWRQMPDKLQGTEEDAANLTNMVFAFAADPSEPPLEIPDGAFLETGIVARFDPAEASPENPIIVSPESGEAALVVDDPAVFPLGTGMVTAVLSLEPGDDVVEPGGFIPGFQAYEQGYKMLLDTSPTPAGGGVIIALCVVLPAPPLVIGHLHDSSVQLLVPMDPDPESLGYIDCSGATATTGGVEFVAAPAWLQLAGRLVQPVAKLFEPKPLNAMLFAGRGLGGRTDRLSLDAGVEATINVGDTVRLSVGTDATWSSDNTGVATVGVTTGLVTGVGPGAATILAVFGTDSLTTVITVVNSTTTTVTSAPLALLGSNPQDSVSVSPAPPAGSEVELFDDRASGQQSVVVAFPDASGFVAIPANLTFEARSIHANFLGAVGFLPSSSDTVSQHVVQRFDDQASFEAFLGGSPVATQDFELDSVGTPITNLIPGQLDMTSPFETLEVWDCAGSNAAFGLDSTTRASGNGRYEMVFDTSSSNNSLAFDIAVQDPATGPALVDVNSSVGSLTLSVLNPGPSESTPVYLGVAATLDLQSVVVNEGPEVGGGPTNEEVCIDNIAIASSAIPVPVFNTLDVGISSGEGQITGGGGIVCSAPTDGGDHCSQAFVDWVTVSLIASPAPGHVFIGWTGDCTFTANPWECLVDMDTNQTVTAAFIIEPPV